MKDQAVEVVGQIGQSEFRLGPLDADGADEQPEPVFFDARTHARSWPGSRTLRRWRGRWPWASAFPWACDGGCDWSACDRPAMFRS